MISLAENPFLETPQTTQSIELPKYKDNPAMNWKEPIRENVSNVKTLDTYL